MIEKEIEDLKRKFIENGGSVTVVPPTNSDGSRKITGTFHSVETLMSKDNNPYGTIISVKVGDSLIKISTQAKYIEGLILGQIYIFSCDMNESRATQEKAAIKLIDKPTLSGKPRSPALLR